MKKLLRFFCVMLFFLGITGMAKAYVVTFEDLNEAPGWVGYATLSDYEGIDWNNDGGLVLGQNGDVFGTNYPQSGYGVGLISGVVNVHSPSSHVYVDWLGEGTYNYNGAWFTSAWSDQEIFFAGWANDTQIYTSQHFQITTTQPLWIELNWTGIDRLGIMHTGSQWVMDDFTFNEPIDPVPEPTTMILLATGLIGLAGFRRKKKK